MWINAAGTPDAAAKRPAGPNVRDDADTTKIIPREPADAKKKTDEQLKKELAEREAGMTDEQLSGITKSRRRTLIKQAQQRSLSIRSTRWRLPRSASTRRDPHGTHWGLRI
jgi:hypothetical protein